MLQQLETQAANLIILVILSMLTYVSVHVKRYVVTHTTAQQRRLVKELIDDAVPYIKQYYPEADPQTLLQKATDHVAAIATSKGLTVDEAEVKAAASVVLAAIK